MKMVSNPFRSHPTLMKHGRLIGIVSTTVIVIGIIIIMSVGNNNANTLITKSSSSMLESRLRGALWGFFSGDALAAPTHWHYGGFKEITKYYGWSGIKDYTKPKFNLDNSILNKSNRNYGGLLGAPGSNNLNILKNPNKELSVIGDVINHGKEEYWTPGKSIHYHATLERGENTLEAQLARVLMKSVVANRGTLDIEHFRKQYVKFMTTPGSHGDTYASSCHRTFFANMILHKDWPLEKCRDAIKHDVDTMDGLVLPTIAAMAGLASPEQAGRNAAECASAIRNSRELERYAMAWGKHAVYKALTTEPLPVPNMFVQEALVPCAQELKIPLPRAEASMSACYLQESFPSLLNFVTKYLPPDDVWGALLRNANAGGENVHRGSVAGAILGARSGVHQLTPKLIDGLRDKDALSKEIDAFVKAVLRAQNK